MSIKHQPLRRLFAFSIISIMGLQACSILNQDHRSKIANTMLQTAEQQDFDYAVLDSALTAKFVNTHQNKTSLQTFVQQLGGHCDTPASDAIQCSILVKQSFCMNQKLEIIATLNNDTITEIHSKKFMDGC